MLPREEYVEQAYLYGILLDRLDQQIPLQDLLEQVKHELLATTKLPMAIGFMLGELRLTGMLGSAMQKLPHYFSPFQTFLIDQAEDDRGRFDFRVALQIMKRECEYRSESENRQGYFFYQFESLCKNRLAYDAGLTAMSQDPAYDKDWSDWILMVRKELGLVDLSDLIFRRSQEFERMRVLRHGEAGQLKDAPLFNEKEGKIAHANRQKDALFLFAAMQRHLGYPSVPKPTPVDRNPNLIPLMQRQIERLESRMKLLEEENRQGIDITKFYGDLQKPN